MAFWVKVRRDQNTTQPKVYTHGTVPSSQLLIFTEQFPYGNSEPFLQTELEFLSLKFESIKIIPLIANGETKRILPSNVTVEVSFAKNRNGFASNLVNLFRFFSPTVFCAELFKRFKRIANPRALKRFLRASFHCFQVQNWLDAYLKNTDKNTKILCYTYFLTGITLGIGLIKKQQQIKLVSRVHGFDVYANDYPGRYIPYQKQALACLDALLPISQHALDHLQQQHGQLACTAIVSHLGIKPSGLRNITHEKQGLSIVTCSSLIPLKRVHLLIEGIALFCQQAPSQKVQWQHFGDGPLRQEIEQLAKAKLSSAVSWEIKGQIAQQAIFAHYQNQPIDLFVNLSTTEGIPVSIMEAYSYGIPAIATDVNGVPEIVNNENGILLPVDITAREVANALTQYTQLSQLAKENKRLAAFYTWQQNFNAEKNYTLFADFLHHQCI